jgi:hypothetical protein
VIAPRPRILLRSAAILLVGALSAACGSSSPSSRATPDGGVPEASTDASDAAGDAADDGGDHGAVSTTYPAFPVDMPKVLANQGVVLGSPVIVTVTWPAEDPHAATWDAFGDAIGGSSYWKAATSEYGVGAATSGPANHVHMVVPLPKTISYYDLQDFVVLSLGGTLPDAGAPEAGTPDAGFDAGAIEGGSDAGAPDAGSDSGAIEGGVDAQAPEAGTPDAGGPEAGPDAGDAAANPPWPPPINPDGGVEIPIVYAIFIPASTVVNEPDTVRSFCLDGGLSFHDTAVVNGKLVPYAIIAACPSQTLTQLEQSASHEYVEAATNPFGAETTNLVGYDGFDSNYFGWSLYTGQFGNEVGDACENWADSYYVESSTFPYGVQRIWSNAHAVAGHDPCVPVPNGAYSGMTFFPAQESTFTLDLTAVGMSVMTARGVHAPVGQPVTFQVGFYSDGPTEPWTIAYDFPAVTLQDQNYNPYSNGTATVTIDKTSGQNGEKAYVTVTPTTAGRLGFQRMAITWDPVAGSAYYPHYQPIILLNK